MKQQKENPDYTEYNLDCWMKPVWSGDTVFNETLMFTPDPKTKETVPAPLLYLPDKIISVRSFDLKTEYEEGKDYTVEGRLIKLTPSSRIEFWPYDEYWTFSPGMYSIRSAYVPGKYVLFGGGELFYPKQVCVTYTHSDKWGGLVPCYQGGRLPKTATLLEDKKPFKIVYYGDSITVGCDTSGWIYPGHEPIAPFTPIWSDMVTDELRAVTGDGNIAAFNTAVGGQHSIWGTENIGENVVKYEPDLVVIAFGMNDSGIPLTPDAFQKNIELMISAVRAKNPDAEFVLVSTTLPNPDGDGWTRYQPFYEENLQKTVNAISGTALAPMTAVHKYILTQKRYADMTGNNINHPNDFLARIYAQTVSQILLEKI